MITADEIAAEEARLAKLHGVDLDALTPEQLRRVRRGMTTRDDMRLAIVRALTTMWVSGENPTADRVGKAVGCSRSTASCLMKDLSDAGVLIRLGVNGRTVRYIPADLHERAMAEEDDR